MKLKFFPLVIVNLLLSLSNLLSQTNFLAETNTGDFGEEERAYNKKLEAQREQLANIRFGNMLDNTNTIDIISTKDGQSISKKMESYKVSTYKTSNPGAQNFLVFETKDRTKTLCDPISFSATPGNSYTVVIYKENNSVKTMIVDDDYTPQNKESGRFRVFNFLNDTEAEISDQNGRKESNILVNNVKSLENLAATGSVVEILAKLPDKSIRKWRFNVNFENNNSSSAFLIRDSYGRLRPKMSSDGWNQ